MTYGKEKSSYYVIFLEYYEFPEWHTNRIKDNNRIRIDTYLLEKYPTFMFFCETMMDFN